MLRRKSLLTVLAFVIVVPARLSLAQWPPPELYRLPPPTAQPEVSSPTTTGSPATEQPLVAQLPEEVATPAEEIDITDLPAEESESWILPTYWFKPVGWEGGVEIGINGTEGNSEALSIRAGYNLKRKTEKFELSSDLTYLKASADGVETQHNALQNGRYERTFGDHPWTFFIQESLEYDEFKAFDLRLAVNAGMGIRLIETESTKLKARFGAGTSREFGGPNTQWVPEALYGADFERQLTKRQKLKLTTDYFPEWGNLANYRLVTDLGWVVLLDEEHNLNFKLSVNDRYDSTPNGRKPNDINYALLLLWKL